MPARPNIILILADDMGYGDIGAFGNDAVLTPALDALAREGLVLTQHYAASPVCASSRAGLLTGRYPHRTGAIDTLEGRGLDRLALREVTLADALQAAGYATGLVGKWHLGALDPRYHPNRRGFAEFTGFRGGWQDYWDWRLDRNGAISRPDGRYLTDVLTEEAAGFIKRHSHEPFFLHVAYNAPHFPFQVPEDELAPFRENASLTEAVRLIYAMNRRMDRGVARILETVERCGLVSNTLILFTSDNGPQFGGEGERCTTRYNGLFNGCKGNVYEGGMRVPAILKWPDGLPAVERSSEFLHFTDWMPILLALAGVPLPAGPALDGHNGLTALRGDARIPPRRFWQWNRYTPVATCNAAMRDGPWKLIRPIQPEAMWMSPADGERDRQLKYDPEAVTDIDQNPEPERHIPPPPPPLLFHLDSDPYEQTDLAARHPDRVHQMQRALDDWFVEVDAERRSIRD